jgi:hypothetical protein
LPIFLTSLFLHVSERTSSVLLVHRAGDATAAYSHYLRELLAIEGFANIEEVEADDLPAALEQDPDLVVVPRMQLAGAISDRLRTYIEQGGNVLAIQPDQVFLPKLGIEPTFGVIRDGILTVSDAGSFSGLPLDPIQIIIPAVTVRPASDVNATIDGTVTTAHDAMTAAPGIIDVRIGSGRAIVFTFDLAKSVARLRHGDPDMADISAHGYDSIRRTSDLFVGQIDPRQGTVPQADVLTAMLGRAVETLVPQPRIWYYPDADQRTTVIQTSDDDWSTIDQFETMLAVLKQYDATCTYYVVHSSVLTTDLMDRWEQDGHVFSVHPSMPWDNQRGGKDADPQSFWVPDMVRREVARHKEQYGRPVNTVRNHAIRWTGYMDIARIHAELGIRGEANAFSVGQINIGYVVGSGRLAPYVDLSGEVIDHYQIPSHWTEEALINPGHTSSQNFAINKARALTNAVIERAAHRYFTPTVINSHPVSFATYSQPLIENNWQTARELGSPIQSADSWMAWTDARRGLSLSRQNGAVTLKSKLATGKATILLPAGTASGASRQTIWGREYDAVEVTNLTAGETRQLQAAG